VLSQFSGADHPRKTLCGEHVVDRKRIDCIIEYTNDRRIADAGKVGHLWISWLEYRYSIHRFASALVDEGVNGMST
jgi:hypothetical protein